MQIHIFDHACVHLSGGSSAGQCRRCWEWDRPLPGRGRRSVPLLRPFHGEATGIPSLSFNTATGSKLSKYPTSIPLSMLSSQLKSALLGSSKLQTATALFFSHHLVAKANHSRRREAWLENQSFVAWSAGYSSLSSC